MSVREMPPYDSVTAWRSTTGQVLLMLDQTLSIYKPEVHMQDGSPAYVWIYDIAAHRPIYRMLHPAWTQTSLSVSLLLDYLQYLHQ